MCHFEKRYAVLASWHYFECGHGKGPCDGVGGTTKRNADNAVKQGKVLIQDATDFFLWAKQHERGIQYDFVSEQEYESTKALVDKRNAEIKPLKGSMLLHAVVGTQDGRIAVRNTSCACDECFKDGAFQIMSGCGWTESTIIEKTTEEVKRKTVEDETSKETNNSTNDQNDHNVKDKTDDCEQHGDEQDEERVQDKAKKDLTSSANKFAVARYERKCYIGKICKVDTTDDTLFVKFMTTCGKYAGHFKWPNKEDSLWMTPDDIVTLIADPMPTGKTGRMYTVGNDVLDLLK